MKAFKIIVVILLVLALLLGIGAYLLVKNIDGLVASAIESIGTEVLQTEVNVDSVDITIGSGRGEIHGFSIANLEGFDEPMLFSLDQVALQIEPSSLQGNVLVLDEITIDGAKLTMEHKGVTTNLQTLVNHLRSQSGSSEPSQSNGAAPRFMIEQLAFTNISMDVVSPQLENHTLTLNDIRRENLGDRTTGLTAEELAQAVIQPLIDEAKARFDSELKARVGSEVQKALDENLSDEEKEKLEGLKSLLNQ